MLRARRRSIKKTKTSKTSFFATHWVTPIGITIVSHLAHRRVSCVRAWRASRSVPVFAFQGGHADEVSRWDAELAFPSSRHLQRLLPSRLHFPAGIFRTGWLTQTWTVVSVSVWQRVCSAFCSNEWQWRVPTGFITAIRGAAQRCLPVLALLFLFVEVASPPKVPFKARGENIDKDFLGKLGQCLIWLSKSPSGVLRGGCDMQEFMYPFL